METPDFDSHKSQFEFLMTARQLRLFETSKIKFGQEFALSDNSETIKIFFFKSTGFLNKPNLLEAQKRLKVFRGKVQRNNI